MSLRDLISPLSRHFYLFVVGFVLLCSGIFWSLSQLPTVQKTTIYFSITPIEGETTNLTSLDPAESSMKTAEAIAGWAQNPAFRNAILETAGVEVGNLKRKLAARKQNYLNVFWTLKLHNDEAQHANVLSQSIITNVENRFSALSSSSAFPLKMTTPEVATQDASIPKSWSLSFALVCGLILSMMLVYLYEAVRGRVSFIYQIKKVFPESPILQILDRPGKHDEKLLEQFILTFESPRLIGTFPAAEKFFSLSPADSINGQTDTPVFLVKTGTTTVLELENLKAIFGDQCGLIIFNK